MRPVIRRRVHALYRCFTHHRRTIVILPPEGTVFHPLKGPPLWIGTVFHPPFPVDRHGVSPTEGTVFHPPQPTENPVTTRACKTVTRARVFNFKEKLLTPPAVENPTVEEGKERPLAAYGAGRNHPRRGACRSPCPSLRLAGSTPFGDLVPPCLRHRLPFCFHSTAGGRQKMAQNLFLMPCGRFPLPESFACAVGQI